MTLLFASFPTAEAIVSMASCIWTADFLSAASGSALVMAAAVSACCPALVQDVEHPQRDAPVVARELWVCLGLGELVLRLCDEDCYLQLLRLGIQTQPIDEARGCGELGLVDRGRRGIEVGHQLRQLLFLLAIWPDDDDRLFEVLELAILRQMDRLAGALCAQRQLRKVLVGIGKRQQLAEQDDEVLVGRMRGELGRAEGEGRTIVRVERSKACAAFRR